MSTRHTPSRSLCQNHKALRPPSQTAEVTNLWCTKELQQQRTYTHSHIMQCEDPANRWPCNSAHSTPMLASASNCNNRQCAGRQKNIISLSHPHTLVAYMLCTKNCLQDGHGKMSVVLLASLEAANICRKTPYMLITMEAVLRTQIHPKQ